MSLTPSFPFISLHLLVTYTFQNMLFALLVRMNFFKDSWVRGYLTALILNVMLFYKVFHYGNKVFLVIVTSVGSSSRLMKSDGIVLIYSQHID